MTILGIMWEENSTAALMKDGVIVASVSEERFSREKNDERYPKKAIEYVLKAGNIKPNDIDIIAFTGTIWKPYYILTRRYSKSTIADALREQKEFWYPLLYRKRKSKYFDIFKNKIDLNQYPYDWGDALKILKKDDESVRSINNDVTKFFQKFRKDAVVKHLGVDPEKIVFVDHHRAHAHYAYFSSPFRSDDTLIVTADAWGDNINATLNTVRNGVIKRIYSCDKFILGRLYRYITLLLGMKPNEHEYKVMGLAPYAKEKYFKDALTVFKNTQIVKGIKFKYKKVPSDMYFYFKERLEGVRFDSIAGALQRYTENLMTNWISNAIKKTGSRRVCLAGGTAMNVKANMKIGKLKQVKEIFLGPSPGDESQAMGSIFVAMADYCRENNLSPNKNIKTLKNAYLGPEINEEDLKKLINKIKNNNKYRIKKNVKPKYVANLLSNGKIVGRAGGRSEFGARALGNRSIIADPRNREIISTINQKVKNRDFWMPFAVTILEKRAKDYLKGYTKSGAPYMTMAFETTKKAHGDLKAGLHPIDLTSRPQVLKKNMNPEYEEIIKEFEKITGVGGLLNTSFNLHGEPIVQTAQDAYRVFKMSDIDALLINKTLIEKK